MHPVALCGDFADLVRAMVADGMSVTCVDVPEPEAMYFKCVLEAHPGLATVHVPRPAPLARAVEPTRVPVARAVEPCARRTLMWLGTSPELARELEETLHELAGEIDIRIERRIERGLGP
jgi:hypothetical protein